MPTFITSALALLRSSLFGTPGRAALTGLTAGTLTGGIDLLPGDPLSGLFGGEKKRRRRRRRALTASDRADIGFITAMLGKTAGKEFAIVISTR